MKTKIINILLSFLLFGFPVFAKNYYIDPQNGSMKNNGTFEKPWSTLDSVMLNKHTLLSGGDTLFLRTGFHGNRIVINDSHGLPVTIIAQDTHTPVLLQLIINGSNWVFDNLNFTPEGNNGQGTPGSFDNGTFLRLGKNSAHNVIRNCKFYSAQDVSGWEIKDWRNNVWSGITDYGNGNVIQSNHLFNIAFAIQLAEVCDSSMVIGNTIENFSGDGIRIGGADFCTIENNVIKNCIELDANSTDGNHEDGIQAWDFDDGVNGLVVRGNYIINYENPNQKFKGLLQGIGFFDGFYNNCIIENNVVIVEHWHGISLYGAKDCKIINNTVLPNPGGSSVAGPPWIGIFPHKDGRESSGNIVRNNLATASNLSNSGAITDHNIFNRSAYKFCRDYNNLDFYPEPDFVFNGQSIIDSGSEEYAPLYDINGTVRPQGNGFDIGAYEYVDSATSIDNVVVKVSGYKLLQNFPNPFNPTTTIRYTIPSLETLHATSQRVRLKVYNILGKEVATLVNRKQKPGIYKVLFDANELPSGVYYYCLTIGSYSKTEKMILLK